MGWDGSGNFNRNNGVFTGAQVWQNDRDASVKIRADRHDTHDEDIATGLENCVTRDGQNTALANLPMGGFRHLNVSNGAARNQYAAVAQMQDQGPNYVAVPTGTADAIVLSPAPAITAYAAGQRFAFRAAGTNTGAVTVNVSTVGARAVQKLGAALVAGDITINDVVELRYDGTQFQMISPARDPVLTAGAIVTADIANNAVTLGKQATGTAGNMLAYDAGGALAAVATGTAGQVATSNGAGAAPTMQSLPVASTTVAGISEYADQTEMEASATGRTVTPNVLKFHPGVPKGWVNFNGTGTLAIRASYNVTSVTDNGTGDYTVNWDTNFSGLNNYAALATGECTVGVTAVDAGIRSGGRAAGSTRVGYHASGSVAAVDSDECHVIGLGDQ